MIILIKDMSVDELISVTPTAADKIKALLGKDNHLEYGLRLAVKGGGCSGFTYRLAFEEKGNEDDMVLQSNDVRLYVDPKSVLYLTGASIDYVDGLMGAGFKISNPNAVSSCGCGESFSA